MSTCSSVYTTHSFPYPELLSQFSSVPILEEANYFLVKPHASVKLMIKKIRLQKSDHGIYISSDIQKLSTIFSRTKCCRSVYNFHNEKQPWLFMEESAESFATDMEKLIRFLKTLKKK